MSKGEYYSGSEEVHQETRVDLTGDRRTVDTVERSAGVFEDTEWMYPTKSKEGPQVRQTWDEKWPVKGGQEGSVQHEKETQ